MDPFALPYPKLAEKFQNLIEEFKLKEFKLLSSVVPPITGVCYGLEVDHCMHTYGVTEENLFLPVMDKVNKCMLEPERLSEAASILTNNRRYLFAAVTDCLHSIRDGLDSILPMQVNKYLGMYEASSMVNRKNIYLKGKKWEDDKNEFYNEIRMMTIAGQEMQTLHFIKMNIFYRLKRNKLGAVSPNNNKISLSDMDIYNSWQPFTQPELNEYLRLSSQYELVCKLLDYKDKWSIQSKDSLFVNQGTEHIVHLLVPYLATTVGFESRKMYAALWLALGDLDLLQKKDASSFKDWVNNSFLKDAPCDSGKGGRINTEKTIREAVDDMYKFQTRDGKQRKFKDLTETEISLLKNGDKLKEPYLKCVLILAKSFGIDLTEQKFQTYVTACSHSMEILEKIPGSEEISRIVECFKAYEDFQKH